jgi:DnaK suppressor protein
MAEDLNLIHFRLTQERERLTEELEHIEASNRPTGDTGGSWFGKRDEQANKVTESRKQQYTEDHLRELLAKVEHALHKFDEGTYSFCDSCGQSIDPARLEALPYTTLCLNCKALQERQSR